MKIKELADELGVKESYLKAHWTDVVKRYDGYGIQLVKMGRGEKAEYGIKYLLDKEVRFTTKD